MSMKESKAFWSRKRPRGQSIVEFTMMLPILLIIISGIMEFGFIFMHYLSVLDAVRNSARFASNGIYDTIDDGIKNCDRTKGPVTNYFYRQVACEAVAELTAEQPTIELCLPIISAETEDCKPNDWTDAAVWNKYDDVIVSAFTVLRLAGPTQTEGATAYPTITNDQGWSYDADIIDQSQGAVRTGMHLTRFNSTAVWTNKFVAPAPGATPNAGYVLVEIHYNYNQVLGLPWFTAFVSDPITFNLYAFWPCESAEPMPTPVPVH